MNKMHENASDGKMNTFLDEMR